MTIPTTWIDPEDRAYPHGGYTRRARVRIRLNRYDPTHCAELDGQYRMVRASIPDTYFSIPARLRTTHGVVQGFISREGDELTFTPEKR